MVALIGILRKSDKKFHENNDICILVTPETLQGTTRKQLILRIGHTKNKGTENKQEMKV